MGLFDELDAISNADDTRETILKPPFPWHGGKSKSVLNLLPNLPYRSVYVEPFGGSGAVLLSRHTSAIEVLNDRHSGITDFYKCLRSPNLIDQLIEYLDLMLHSREEFVHCRDTWQEATNPVERAAKWYYLVLYSFATHQRNFGRSTGANGVITAFAGKIQKKLTLFREIHRRLQTVTLENMDYLQVMRDYDSKGTVHYLDPPYLNTYDAYNHQFTIDDHKRMLDNIFKMKGYVALSGYENSLYDSYPWTRSLKWNVTVTSKAMAFHESNNKLDAEALRAKATECLWIKE